MWKFNTDADYTTVTIARFFLKKSTNHIDSSISNLEIANSEVWRVETLVQVRYRRYICGTDSGTRIDINAFMGLFRHIRFFQALTGYLGRRLLVIINIILLWKCLGAGFFY